MRRKCTTERYEERHFYVMKEVFDVMVVMWLRGETLICSGVDTGHFKYVVVWIRGEILLCDEGRF